MSTTDGFLRVGDYVINLPKINHIWFGNCDDEAFIDFGEGNDERWDLILTGADARALRSYFDQRGEGR